MCDNKAGIRDKSDLAVNEGVTKGKRGAENESTLYYVTFFLRL